MGLAPGSLGCATDATAHRLDSVRDGAVVAAHRGALGLLAEVESELPALLLVPPAPAPLLRPRRLPREHVFECGAHLFGILERTVHGGETDIRDLVELAQALHDHLADLSAGDLEQVAAAELVLNLVDHHLQ